MTVNGFLASMAVHSEVADPVLIEQVWFLASRSGDHDLLVAILERDGAIPDAVRDSARAMKETLVRVAYLTRPDVSTDERAALLENEKRSDVFAGLIAVAKDNAEIAERLAEQLAKKPTKVLARTMLNACFSHGESTWIALKTVASDRTMSQSLEARVAAAAVSYSSNEDRCAELVEFVSDGVLLALDPSRIPDKAQARYIERMLALATAKSTSWDWEIRRRANSAGDCLLRFALRENLPTESIAALDAATLLEDFAVADQVASVLAGRLSLESAAGDARYDAAKAAEGNDLDRMIEFALVCDPAENAVFLQGLLENPRAVARGDFKDLLARAKPVTMVRAMASAKSVDLFSAIWHEHFHDMPEECWGFLPDQDAALVRLFADEVAALSDPEERRYYGGVPPRLMKLLERGAPNHLVASLPFEVFSSPVSHYNRWASAQLVSVVGKQIAALQLERLGADPQMWENFNNLSSSWSGTLGELLDAACTL